MVEGNASMYLGSPRMAEMVIGEQTTLEEMGGARMHATVSGCGDNLAVDDVDAIEQAKAVLAYLPADLAGGAAGLRGGAARPATLTADMVPDVDTQGYDMHTVIDGLVDAESFFEVKPLFAPELIVGLRAARRPPGRRRRQQPDGARRRAVRRLAPTRPPASSGGATPSTSRWCSSPTCPAS